MVTTARHILKLAVLVALFIVIAVPQHAKADLWSAQAFVYPVLAPKKTSGFGSRHHPVLHLEKHHDGVDLAAPTGAVIRSVKQGRVIFADPNGAYGNLVVVDHGNGLTTHYGHCQTIRVSPGDTVAAGQIIATVGATGRVTGSHLHFELRYNGKALDPEKYIPSLNAEAQG
jgi:murein DD-endopeptidase MepM/ murein hydrolase activator NlpD